MQITKNFKLSEFDCKDGSVMPDTVIFRVVKLANQLQVLRDYLNKPISINSGYRSKSYNAIIGGVTNSQHILGNASDITVKGLKPLQVKEAIEHLINKGDMLQGGIGLYKTFIHYDIGYNGKKRRWQG